MWVYYSLKHKSSSSRKNMPPYRYIRPWLWQMSGNFKNPFTAELSEREICNIVDIMIMHRSGPLRNTWVASKWSMRYTEVVHGGEVELKSRLIGEGASQSQQNTWQHLSNRLSVLTWNWLRIGGQLRSCSCRLFAMNRLALNVKVTALPYTLTHYVHGAKSLFDMTTRATARLL